MRPLEILAQGMPLKSRTEDALQYGVTVKITPIKSRLPFLHLIAADGVNEGDLRLLAIQAHFTLNSASAVRP